MNLQYYKQNVSIIQLVETLGYAYNRSKGRYPRQYEHPNGDKVIIYDKAKSIGVRLHVLIEGAPFHIETREASPPQS